MKKKSPRSSPNIWEDFDDIQVALQFMHKTGRNDLCWCRAGEKYKRCHLDRSKEPPFRIHEYIKIFRKFLNKGYCLHPHADLQACIGPIVKAHTIQRNGSLSRIARAGNVYTFLTDHNLSSDSLAAPKIVGVSKASTFTGFCKLHDDNTFAPIEKYSFQSNPEHTFLLGYRALCHEFFTKKAGLEFILPYQQRNLDRGKSLLEQYNIQAHLYYLKAGFALGMRDLSRYKAAYDKALSAQDFSDTRYYVIRLNNAPDFLCSGTILPEYSFDGKMLQRLSPGAEQLDHLTFSLIATDLGGAAVFSWHGKSGASEQFVRSLDALSDHELPHAIVRFMFETFENVFASPDWWERLDNEAQQKLLARQLSGMASSDTEWTNDCLMDDGVRAVNWTVSSRETNLTL